MKNYRHGDISLHLIDKLPDGIKKVKSNGVFNLKEGEATGHFHQLKGDFEIYQDEEGRNVLNVNKKSTLTHPEHKEITIEKGIYIQEQEIEYDPFTEELNKVID